MPTNDELLGRTISFSGSELTLTSNLITAVSEDVKTVTEGVVIAQKDNATFNNILLSQKGTYFYKDLSTGAHTIRLSKQTVTPMAEEFIPNIPADKLPTGANSTTVFYL